MKTAEKVTVLTGAGISAESGIPTFRDKDGLWNKMRPEELASFDAFMRNPGLVWEWYQMRKDIVQSAEPNKGHLAVVELEELYREFALVTQNVDNLHRRAGSRNVFELHGNIERSYCIACRKSAGDVQVSQQKKVPFCHCGGKIRPDIVWFGEMLPEDVLRRATLASERCEVFLSVGTSSVVYPAAGLPLLARQCGAMVVEVNARETDLSSQADFVLRGSAGEVLPKLVDFLKK